MKQIKKGKSSRIYLIFLNERSKKKPRDLFDLVVDAMNICIEETLLPLIAKMVNPHDTPNGEIDCNYQLFCCITKT